MDRVFDDFPPRVAISSMTNQHKMGTGGLSWKMRYLQQQTENKETCDQDKLPRTAFATVIFHSGSLELLARYAKAIDCLDETPAHDCFTRRFKPCFLILRLKEYAKADKLPIINAEQSTLNNPANNPPNNQCIRSPYQAINKLPTVRQITKKPA